MKYALITGASKGIGKALAYELAQKGYGLLLVARSEELLSTYANELTAQFNVSTAYLALDLANQQAAQIIFDWVNKNGYEVEILINNAGYGLNGLINTYSLDEHLQMLQVNINSLVSLTYLFIPHLRDRKRAYIANIASSAAYQSVPGLNIYAASKAFVLSFSRGLSYELSNTTISVSCVCPGATDTQFAERANVTNQKAIKMAEKFNMSPSDVAKISIKGIFAGKTEIVPGFINKIAKVLALVIPDKILEKSAASIYGL